MLREQVDLFFAGVPGQKTKESCVLPVWHANIEPEHFVRNFSPNPSVQTEG
jgi:hypothetical protein